MGSKQEKLEATVQLENCLTAITEILLDEFCDWSVAIDGYRLSRRDSQGRRGGGIALYVRKQIECEELSLKNCYEQVKSLQS